MATCPKSPSIAPCLTEPRCNPEAKPPQTDSVHHNATIQHACGCSGPNLRPARSVIGETAWGAPPRPQTQSEKLPAKVWHRVPKRLWGTPLKPTPSAPDQANNRTNPDAGCAKQWRGGQVALAGAVCAVARAASTSSRLTSARPGRLRVKALHIAPLAQRDTNHRTVKPGRIQRVTNLDQDPSQHMCRAQQARPSLVCSTAYESSPGASAESPKRPHQEDVHSTRHDARFARWLRYHELQSAGRSCWSGHQSSARGGSCNASGATAPAGAARDSAQLRHRGQ